MNVYMEFSSGAALRYVAVRVLELFIDIAHCLLRVPAVNMDLYFMQLGRISG